MDSHERASLGGRARAAKLTAAERSESARRAVRARWGKAAPALSLGTFCVGLPGEMPPQAVTITRCYAARTI